jgi:two-component system, response regulator YesN
MPYTILLVDDDPVFREEFRDVLLMEKYDVMEATGGQECLNLIKRPNIIDLVILDQKMPDMDGINVLKKIKEMDPDKNIIILTGYSTKEVAIEALRGDADDYLEKPLEIEHALAAIKNTLEKKEKKVKGIINKIKYLIEKNFHKNITLKEASDIVYLSPKYISRLFKEKAGTGFREYKLKVKMDKARELLKKTDYNINEISTKTGYLNIESFITSFKKTTGCTPTEYRQRNDSVNRYGGE